MMPEPSDNVPSNQVAPFSVTQAAQIYTESLRTNLSKVEMIVSGFYKDSKRRDYNGIYYDYLLDIDNRSSLTIKIPERIKKCLTDGECYELSGFFNLNRKDSTLQLTFNITSVVGKNKESELVTEDEYNLIKARYDKGLHDIALLTKNCLRERGYASFGIVTGETSIVDRDFYRELGDNAQRSYSISFIKTNLSSATEILNSLDESELDEFDFLVFMRGGGSGIEIFDDRDLCKGIIELGKPFIVAIGHAVDMPFLHKLADLSFVTPSAFGTFLREIHDDVASEASILLSQEKEISRLDGELKQLSTNYEKRIQNMEFNYNQRQLHFERSIVKQRKIAIYIVAALVVILFLVLYFK